MSGWSRKLFALVALLALAACSRREPAAAQVLRVSQRNEPADLDPARATLPDEFFIIRALSEGLLIPDPAGGAPLPAAAGRFDVSADGLTYTFHLRDARWSNGEPVTADDFVASYRRVLTPATAAPKADLFFAVKNARAFLRGELADFTAVGFAAPDPRTLVVTLAQPNPRFPLYAASGPWIPVNPRVVEKFGRAWTQPANFVGNGPFTLAEWRPQQRIVVRKNPAYHGAAGVRLDALQFLRFDNDDTEERTFRTGQLDVTMSVPFTKLATYAREHPAELHRAPLAETRFLSFNTQRPPLADARVRRALALALDRARLVERVTRGGQEPAVRFLPPALAPAGAPPADDRTGARALLAAAGFAGGKNFPRLELSAWSPSQTPVLEAIQAMWRQELGLEVRLAIREARVHLAALVAGDYDIAFATTTPLLDVADPAALLANFAGAAPNNYPHWRSADFDRALAAGDLARAEALLLAEAPVAPLYFNVHHWLMAPRVRGWQEDALWSRCYLHVHLDEK
jgi:oligopeptide transport system substrate-binding protein